VKCNLNHTLLVTERFINISVNIKLEGATMNSMSNVRGRKVPNETPHVLEGSGLTTAPVDGMERKIRGMRARG
jgi:hypothetical protein